MERWWERMIHGAFDPTLARLYTFIPVPYDDPGRTDHLGSSFFNGYYGYVEKAVRMALGEAVEGGYSVLRCADGTLAGCRKALRDSLAGAVATLGPDPSTWEANEAADQIEFMPIGLVQVPPIPWQNRPTFQQVVQVTSHRPRQRRPEPGPRGTPPGWWRA